MSDRVDYVQRAYETFVKNAEGLDPTDPKKAIEQYFERNASDELKARAKAEKKTIKGCWEFIWAVARKVGGNCHLDPSAVYAMVMHYFENVPADWDKKPEPEKKVPEAKPAKAKKPAETPSEIRKEKERKAKAAPKKSAKPKREQAFFFNLLEEQPVSTPPSNQEPAQ